MKFFDFRLRIIDRYIIRKFIGTYLSAITFLVCVSIVFDLSEKIEKMVATNAPLRGIIFDYYLNFVPYFINLYSPLLAFISVIFVTSRMAYRTEIIAILSSGISFMRLMYPYFVSASIIATLSVVLNLFIIPNANKKRQVFENVYIKKPYYNTAQNIHMQLEPGVMMYMSYYNTMSKTGDNFSLERFEGNQLKSKLISDRAVYDSAKNVWRVYNYYIRDIGEDGSEAIRSGMEVDTIIPLTSKDLSSRWDVFETMNYFELNNEIAKLQMRGAGNINAALNEKYMRIAMPFSSFILTLIGVSLSSRKVRGGVGLHIGLGIGLGFTYILFIQFSAVFVKAGAANPALVVWMPNIIFAIIALVLYRLAPK